MLLLLIDQPGGIGFLFAAKSILRFGEIKDSQHRKMAEYILIGTFRLGPADLLPHPADPVIAGRMIPVFSKQPGRRRVG
jgi:hypothetical protein